MWKIFLNHALGRYCAIHFSKGLVKRQERKNSEKIEEKEREQEIKGEASYPNPGN